MKLFYFFLLAIMPLISIQLSRQEIKRVGSIIWTNECKKNPDLLIFWNEKEEFPSLGIGHFIWHTKASRVPFSQQFPDLISYLKKNNITIPEWLETSYAPWPDRNAFLAERNSMRMNELLQLLLNTIDLQASFIVNRFQTVSLPAMAKAVKENERDYLNKQLNRLYAMPSGIFALIDYADFKGDGINPAERYKNTGWGLLQVLLNMKETDSALHDFVMSAQEVLKTRVENAPRERNEQRFLPGWNNRVKSYLSIK